MSSPYVSICVLCYNRPETLRRLLGTIDTSYFNDIEIILCDDYSPRRSEIRAAYFNWNSSSKFRTKLIENSKNLGFDGTFQELFKAASGQWLIFMGDDDEFVPGAFDDFYKFLKGNSELGYVMKSHYTILNNGNKELFKYYSNTKYFSPGVDAYCELFRKSVFIAGFAIRKDCAKDFLTDRFDGSMLIQVYLMAEVVLRHPSAYYDSPFTQQYESLEHNNNDVMFDRENLTYIPRTPTLDISINFLRSFLLITQYLDRKYGFNSTDRIRLNMSKYFYPNLAIHRKHGIYIFWKYVNQLGKIGFNGSIYFYIYAIALTFLGKKNCDSIIRYIKNTYGRTPSL